MKKPSLDEYGFRVLTSRDHEYGWVRDIVCILRKLSADGVVPRNLRFELWIFQLRYGPLPARWFSTQVKTSRLVMRKMLVRVCGSTRSSWSHDRYSRFSIS